MHKEMIRNATIGADTASDSSSGYVLYTKVSPIPNRDLKINSSAYFGGWQAFVSSELALAGADAISNSDIISPAR